MVGGDDAVGDGEFCAGGELGAGEFFVFWP